MTTPCRDCGALAILATARAVRRASESKPSSALLSIGLINNKFLPSSSPLISKPPDLAVLSRSETAAFLADKPVSILLGWALRCIGGWPAMASQSSASSLCLGTRTRAPLRPDWRTDGSSRARRRCACPGALDLGGNSHHARQSIGTVRPRSAGGWHDAHRTTFRRKQGGRSGEPLKRQSAVRFG